jgi:hypothetical protein
MTLKQKAITAVLIVSAVALGVAATAPGRDNGYTNLKILPENIPSKMLLHIMTDEFEDGLGVNCGFCHAGKKDSHSLDYASDEKPEKQIARKMMQMTLGLNKKYFRLKKPMIGDSLLVVTCTTCHRGTPHPDPESIK